MEKSFYYLVEWSDIGYLKDALQAMEIPFAIEQPSDKLNLAAGHVAFVFPVVPVRVYKSVLDLFGSHGRSYPV
ncbi:hypothetical protein [Brevibacillus sp. HD3.3A]|uniref:hypothetical protein n=1 Tax=Brevibacillus sp. HD3.3A TaxID=2738979 RepID=UPI00156B40DF|nr:hypothetical protein [Brevibacillus sp. HD3.3A]UED72121.1 hypothetical protein HP435_28870 [Brevibacillus sp. HD3.3A]